MQSLNVGLIGLGTVGTGVARLLTEEQDRLARRAGRPLVLRRVALRDPSRPREVKVPAGAITTDPLSVARDPSVDVVIELMGGVDRARDVVLAALDAGKDVVTANKALLCAHGGEIFQRAKSRGRCVAFEAAVAGGVPIIATVAQALAANQITSIEAILNGTSNFILTGMLSGNRSYRDVLGEAQRLGYAEADPTLDIDGTDAAQKLIILTQLAFGTKVALADVARQGIDMLELADLVYADELGYTVKLLAVAKLAGEQLEIHVQPTLVHKTKPLAQVAGAYNMIRLAGDAVGSLWLSGAGAGQMPTASAVVADLIDVAAGRSAISFARMDVWQDRAPLAVQPAEEISRRFYLRFNVDDRPHVFAEIADILGRNGISLASIIQHEAPELDSPAARQGEYQTVPVVVMTHRTTEGLFRQADAELDRLQSVRVPRVRMPVAD